MLRLMPKEEHPRSPPRSPPFSARLGEAWQKLYRREISGKESIPFLASLAVNHSSRFRALCKVGRQVPQFRGTAKSLTASIGGVVQYDFGDTTKEGQFIRTSLLNKPPQILLNAIASLEAEHMIEDFFFSLRLVNIPLLTSFSVFS